MEFKNAVKAAAKGIARCFFNPLVSIGAIPKRVIVRMDGGICSQMHFFLVGEVFRSKGYSVSYDLEWFRLWGKDINGIYARNFDLLKAFPYLQAAITDRHCTLIDKIYRICACHQNNYFDASDRYGWMKLKPPVYLSGYYHTDETIYRDIFPKVFRPNMELLSGKSLEVLDRIRAVECRSVAVHVRRGDLSEYIEAYGHPASIEYFRMAFTRMTREIGDDAVFFLFSDEPAWCREKLLPALPESISAEVADANSSENGWMDMFLISQCRNHITSKGSLGKFGALMRDHRLRDGLVILCREIDGRQWQSRFPYADCL